MCDLPHTGHSVSEIAGVYAKCEHVSGLANLEFIGLSCFDLFAGETSL